MIFYKGAPSHRAQRYAHFQAVTQEQGGAPAPGAPVVPTPLGLQDAWTHGFCLWALLYPTQLVSNQLCTKFFDPKLVFMEEKCYIHVHVTILHKKRFSMELHDYISTCDFCVCLRYTYVLIFTLTSL